MKKIHLCLIGIATIFLTACTVGVSTNKNSVINDTNSITNLKVTFDFNGGKYNGSAEQVIFNDVKPTSYWKYVKTRIDETKITSPEHTTFKGFSFAQDDSNIIDDSYVIKENITVYAQYNPKEGEYCTVNWKDGETSEIIKTETYFEGETPEFKGTIPYHKDKSFNHWEPEIHAVTQEDIAEGSIDYTAIYVPITTIYTVTLDYYGDGSEIHIQKVLNGECAIEPKITKEGHYKLTKWEYTSGGTGDFDFDTPITKDGIEIKAIWVEDTYTVTWLNYDGTPLEAQTKEYYDGEVPVYDGTPPTRKSDIFHDYEFTGEWYPALSEIHSDMTYVAKYQVHLYKETEAYMYINVVDGNKDFEFTCTATSSITIDWGDGTPQETKAAGTISHTYDTAGEYNIRIFNPITSISVSGAGATPPPDSALIEELYLGKDVTSIGNYAFYRCSQLQTVTFEEGSKLTLIGERAFRECSALTSINIPSGVTSIGVHAFYGCSSLTSSINIPSGVTSIGDYTFFGCSKLEIVTFEAESQLTLIGNYAFYRCSQLQTVTFEEGSKLTLIGARAFENCSNLTSINIPSGVTSIGQYAFENCSNLTSINIPSGVTIINYQTFFGCSKLETVTFDSGSQLETIYTNAFKGCSALTNITIPSGVTTISNSAFNGCSALTSINIPNSVTSIGDWAFADCSRLESVDLTTYTINDAIPPLNNSSIFENCSSELKFHVASEEMKGKFVEKGWPEEKIVIDE